MKKSCEKCINYKKHYFILSCGLVNAQTGHCIIGRDCKDVCKHWEESDEKERAKQITANLLHDLSAKLDEILMILKI